MKLTRGRVMSQQKKHNVGDLLCFAIIFMIVLVLVACSGDNRPSIDILEAPTDLSKIKKNPK